MCALHKFTLLMLLVLSYPPLLHASDAAQNIQIRADSMQLDVKSGTTTYLGNVSLQQQDTRLSGEKIVINHRDGEINRVEIQGKPARYWYQDAQGDVRAESQQMHYQYDQHMLTLLGNARLEQAERLVESQRIVYDTQKQLVLAGKADAAGDANQNGERVNITLTPKKTDPSTP